MYRYMANLLWTGHELAMTSYWQCLAKEDSDAGVGHPQTSASLVTARYASCLRYLAYGLMDCEDETATQADQHVCPGYKLT